jgi:hypothetical protein
VTIVILRDAQPHSLLHSFSLPIMNNPGSSSNVNNDSTTTLVENTQFQFRFSHDNPSNTTIHGPDGRILYRVITSFGEVTVTRVERADGEVLARLFWSSVGYDKIAIGQQAKPVRMGKFLPSGPFFSEYASW